jgi:hypothetical protein
MVPRNKTFQAASKIYDIKNYDGVGDDPHAETPGEDASPATVSDFPADDVGGPTNE